MLTARLAGAMAAQTLLPIIGIPVQSSALNGLDALLSTVQMPPGMPVATVAIDGAKNAALLAARILAGTRPELRERLLAQLEAGKARYDQPVVGAPAQADELGKRGLKRKK